MSKILFLFEGRRFEPEVFKATIPLITPDSNFVNNDKGIVCEYCTHIYTLYSRLKADDGLDLVGLLMEQPDKFPRLCEAVEESGSPEETFESIYLLFDYDGHINMPRKEDGTHVDGDTALQNMLAFFNNASENGKLLISYPMVEAIKHLSEEPTTKETIVTSKCKGPNCPNMECENRFDRYSCPPIREHYKGLVNKLYPRRGKIENISPQEWGHIFICHLRVAELLCSTTGNITSQTNIFNVQLRDFISMQCPQVAVLSSFPFLFLDFLGETSLRERLNNLIMQTHS